MPSAYRTLLKPTVRVARWDFSSVDSVDPRTGAHLCTLLPLDKERNADGRRRALPSAADHGEHQDVRRHAGIAPLLSELMAEYAATGLPPAYIPQTPESDDPLDDVGPEPNREDQS